MHLKKLWHRVVLFFCVNCVIVHITINNDIAANIDNNVKFLNFKNQFWPSKHRFSLVLTLLQIFEWKNQTIYWESKEKLLKSFKPITCPGEFFWSSIWSDSTEQRLRTISTVIRNRKTAWKHGIFLLELKIYVAAVRRIHQNNEKLWFLWEIAVWKLKTTLRLF